MAKTEYDVILNKLKSNRFRSINFRTGLYQDSEEEGAVCWDDVDKTISVTTGFGPTLQVGQEEFTKVWNDTGVTLKNGKVVTPDGGIEPVINPNGIIEGIPHVALAQADPDSFSTIDAIVVLTHDIEPGTWGFATLRGNVRGVDTLGHTPGIAWLSATEAGETTNVRPDFPNYAVRVGGVLVASETEGVIVVSIRGSRTDTLTNFWNGCFRETFDFKITSTGAVITGTLTPANGHPNMTMLFSDGFTMLDTSPGATIVLTPGTDVVPQTNYVYIPVDTKVLTVSTSDWPTTEHIRVAQLYIQSASKTEIEGALRNQNINNEIQDTDTNIGHLQHIGNRIRAMVAEWENGTESSITGTTSNVYINNTSGEVFQMHKQPFPILDMTEYIIDAVNQGNKTFTISDDGDLSSTFPDGRVINIHNSIGNNGLYTIVSTSFSSTDFIITVEETIPDSTADGTIGDDIHVVNDPITAFRETTNLNDLTVDSTGTTLNNKYFSIVVWGVANKRGEHSHIMCNLPSGSYTVSETQAIEDADGHTNYTIPKEFKGVGFLMGRFTLRKSGTIFTYNLSTGYQDLRGFVPNTSAGSGAGSSGITTFPGLTDTPSSYINQAGKFPNVNSGETALEFNNIFVNQDTKLSLNGAGGNTYIIYNSSADQVEIWKGGVLQVSW